MGNIIYSIAIDGPAGAGKSTIAKLVSKKLNIEYIDTGAMYRALTLKVLQSGLDPQKPNDVISILSDTEIDFIGHHIYLDGKLVDNEIRDNVINNNVSYVATIKEVREGMVQIQQNMAKFKSIVMDGRDITTVVLPNADFKFFITASVEERGRRRFNELLTKGNTDITLDKIIEEIKNRDNIDSNRDISPLKIAVDAFVIDTTNMSIDESVNNIISIVKGGI